MSLSEPNKNIRLEGNQRIEKVRLSERAGALEGCAIFFSSAAVLLGAMLTLFGWIQAGITVAVTFVILSVALHCMAMLNESSTRKAKDAEQKWRDDKARDIVERLRTQRALESLINGSSARTSLSIVPRLCKPL